MTECRVRVLNVPRLHNVDLLDKLTIHFLRQSNGGGELTDVSYCTDTPTEAIVTFEDPAVAKRVLETKEHVLKIKGNLHYLQVVPLKEEDSGEVIEKVIMVINLFRIPEQQHDGFLESLKRFPVTVSLNQSQRQCSVEGPFSHMEKIYTHVNTFVNEYKVALKEGDTEGEEFQKDVEKDAQTEIHSNVNAESVPESELSENQERLASHSKNAVKDLGDLSESGTGREESIEMVVESDVFTFLLSFFKNIYDGILSKYNVEVLSNDLGDLTTLNVKSKASLPSSKAQMQNATEELAVLLDDLHRKLRKDTVRLNSALAKNSSKLNALCQKIKDQYQCMLVTYKEENLEVHFIGKPDEIFQASSFLRGEVETSERYLLNQKSEEVSHNVTEHLPAQRSDFDDFYPEEHECMIQVDCDVWSYFSHCHRQTIDFICDKYNTRIHVRDVKNNKTLVILTSPNNGVLRAKEELSSIFSENESLHKQILKYEHFNISPTSIETKLLLQSLGDRHQWVLILEDTEGLVLLGPKAECVSVIEELKELSGKKQGNILEETQVQNVKSHLQEPVVHGQGTSVTEDAVQDNLAVSIADAQPSVSRSQPSTCMGHSKVCVKDGGAQGVPDSLQDDHGVKSATGKAKVTSDANADDAQPSSVSLELRVDENPRIKVEDNNNLCDQQSTAGGAVNIQDIDVENDEERTAPPNAAGGGHAEDISEMHNDKESGHLEAALTPDIPSEAEHLEPCEDANPHSNNIQMDTMSWKYITNFMLKGIEESASKQNVEIKVVRQCPIVQLNIFGMAESNVSAITSIFNDKVQECRKMHREKISGQVLELIQDEKNFKYFVDAINITGLKVVLHKMPKSVYVFGEKEPCMASVEQMKIIAEKFTSSDGDTSGNGGKDLSGKTQLEKCCSEAVPNLTADLITDPVPRVSDEQQ